MTENELYQSLDYVNHSREKRAEMALLVTTNPQLVRPLLKIAFEVDNPISNKACWVLEFTAKENLPFLYPHLDVFTANLGRVHFDSAVRPLAKICEFLTKTYFSKQKNELQAIMTETQLERLTAACFDWLIGEHKVAAKAYSMTSLWLLGQRYPWIHPELKMILEQNYPEGSAAYQARAREILAKLKKLSAQKPSY
ncbi:adenylosuccinate lyase [Zobellia galactanivorans]|uniref:adenylosuccinate lyase n=1 Tax=Zobellia galactanivorans (strain DSM 12802 / CCUG 47099 / CIP 106680 / NCIMB 13871 / Dsij) TaxID=63186 RepID=UPI001C074689|nr:adenylosuccinate lyase [Zobellia galactanivorans]MBU3027143.1 adenylosuccinate lyase [Zobellia galactanivorans]MDO6807926.1 adenylosuccinate lyase [Zobellia galactanivorans]